MGGMKIVVLLAALAVLPVSAQHTVTPPSTPRLALGTVFKGDSKFRAMVQQAERENWRQLPLGARTIRAARAIRRAALCGKLVHRQHLLGLAHGNPRRSRERDRRVRRF